MVYSCGGDSILDHCAFFTELMRKKAEVEIWQHAAMSDAHEDIVEAFQDIYIYVDSLIAKYNCDVNDLLLKTNNEEFNKMNTLLMKINSELYMMYMLMPDNKYKAVRDTIERGKTMKMEEQKNKLLVAIRKAQFPITKFGNEEEIRFYDNFKRPQQKVENKQ